MDWLLSKYHEMLVGRRKARHAKLKALQARYSMFTGPDFWHCSPWHIERSINKIINNASPYEFDDSDEDA